MPGRGAPGPEPGPEPRTAAERQRSLSWAQRLARVFRIDVTRWVRCGGRVRVIAALTDPGVLEGILAALQGVELHRPRAGPHDHPGPVGCGRLRGGGA